MSNVSTALATAAAVAARMTARPLGEYVNGGRWDASYADGDVCEACERTLYAPELLVSTDIGLTLCLPCAVLDCERAEQAAGQWSARCDCRRNHNSTSGRCNVRNVTDPHAKPGDAVLCERCRRDCRVRS